MSQTIAIIEDDQAISQMYRIKFENEGYKVVIADNGKDGLALCEKVKPNIVLLDLMMPEMTGTDMLARMRQTDWGKDTKVIILTNVSQDEATPAVHDLKVSSLILKAHSTPQEVVDITKKVLADKPAPEKV